MSFLNAAILLGLGFVAIPVILHFLLRQKPKPLVFPALRLVQARKRQSVRRLKLRHIWLMLLRMLALLLLVLALARPSLPPANYAFTPFETGTLFALVLAGVGAYAFLLNRLRRQALTRFQYQERKSRLRNWSTAGTLAAVLLLIGWPYQRRISAEITNPRPASELNLPVAGVLIFDNSLSMSYLEAGRTSLDRAREIARAHLQTLPGGSRVAVADTGADRPILFQSTILSAQSRIDALEPAPVALPLDDRLGVALRLQEEDRRKTLSDQADLRENQRRDRYIRRVYILTDLARSAWRTGSSLLRSDLERLRNVNIYIVDVGREAPADQAIIDVSLSSERIPVGGDLLVGATARSQGVDRPEQRLDLMFQTMTGQTARQGQGVVKLDANLPARLEFPPITNLAERWIHGEVRLIGSDSLAFDNARNFTVEVTEPPPILVIAPERETALPWMTALAPRDGLGESQNRFRPHFEPVRRIPELNLSDYPVVTLINVPELSDDAWFQLGKYVENGGGLIVVLGSDDIRSPSYNRAQPQLFLPARLHSWQPENSWNFIIEERHHPAFSIFRRLENYGSFSLMENLVQVFRFWKVDELAEGAHVLARYTDPDRSPALLERSTGRGRTVMLTTGGDLPANSRKRWNNLASPLVDPWLFVAFVEQTTNFASQYTDAPHSFLAGETAIVRLAPQPRERTLLLKEPQLKQSRHTLPADSATLSIPNVQQPGHYELVDPGLKEVVGAFSVNIPAGESDLTRLTKQELGDLLGADRYQLARSLDELKDHINAADLGQEVFPILLVLVLVTFCGELLVSNRFYDSAGETTAA